MPLPSRWLLLALLLPLLSAPLHAASERQLKEAELRQLRESISTLQQQMQRVRTRHDRLHKELRESEQAISRINRNIRQLDGSVGDVQGRVDQLRERQQILLQTLHSQRDHLAGQVRAAYAMGRQETLKILLNQENPATVGRVMTYYDYLNKARTEQIAELSEIIGELEAVRASLDEELQRLRRLRNEREQERQALEKSTQTRQQAMRQLEDELQDQDQQLSSMQQDEEQLAELIRALVEALDDIPKDIGTQSFASQRGQMSMPTRGRVIASFGSARNERGLRWQGIRIGANEGSEVRAVSHGRVAFADWMRGYGMLLIIDHGDGFMTLYGHNQALLKEVGDWVMRDELIATVGDSGPDRRSSLYFEIRRNGRPVDPISWVKR